MNATKALVALYMDNHSSPVQAVYFIISKEPYDEIETSIKHFLDKQSVEYTNENISAITADILIKNTTVFHGFTFALTSNTY